MNFSELMPTPPATLSSKNVVCIMAASDSDSTFLTLPKTNALRSISRTMYDGSRLQPAIVAPPRGSSENRKETRLLSLQTASCSGRGMCQISVPVEYVACGSLESLGASAPSALTTISFTWPTCSFTVSAFQSALLNCRSLETHCCYHSSCDSEKGTGHDAN